MYLSHFGLTENPFKISSDPKFLWLSEKHKEGLATLKYGILDNKGFLLLTGDVGTGKTTLINALINSISTQAIVAVVSDPGLSKLEFYNFLANEFNLKEKFTDKATFLVHFRNFLNEAHVQKKKVLLIIDEAQRLDQDLLEDIRLLSNIEQQQVKLMNIFLIGQNDFNDTLLKIENRAIRQRISLNYHINPLLESETEMYIKHRLRTAGCFQDIFDARAMKVIFYYTKGFPRLINILCDHALLTGYVREQKQIGQDIVKECVNELRITPSTLDYAPEFLSADVQNNDAIVNPPIKEEKGDHHLKNHTENLRNTYMKKANSQNTANKWGYWMLPIVIIVFTAILGLYVFHDHPALRMDKIKNYFRNVHSNLKNQSQVLLEPTHTNHTSMIVSPTTVNTSNDSVYHFKAIPVEHIDEKRPAVALPIQEKVVPIHPKNNGEAPQSPATVDTPEKPKSPVKMDKKPDSQDLLNPEDQEFYSKAISGAPILIQFVSNTNDISQTYYKQLAIIKGILNSLPEAHIDIKGFSDSMGTKLYNKNLSQFRANIVRSYFLGNGIDESRIKATGMGNTSPLMSNETEAGRRANRRVEIQVRLNQNREAL